MSELTIIGAREFETSDPYDLPDTAESLGPRHFPTPHRSSALAMNDALTLAGLDILDQTHVVDGLRTFDRGGNYGKVTVPQAHLFSLYRVSDGQHDDLLVGYRNSVAQSMAMRACVGKYFPVCTNVSLFGDDIVFSRKNTMNADIFTLAIEGVRDRVLPLFRTMEEQIQALRDQRYASPAARRSETLSLFEERVLPAKLIVPMQTIWEDLEQYDGVFDPLFPEVVADRDNRLGLMQACTRLTADLPLRRKAEASQRISRHFGFGRIEA